MENRKRVESYKLKVESSEETTLPFFNFLVSISCLCLLGDGDGLRGGSELGAFGITNDDTDEEIAWGNLKFEFDANAGFVDEGEGRVF